MASLYLCYINSLGMSHWIEPILQGGYIRCEYQEAVEVAHHSLAALLALPFFFSTDSGRENFSEGQRHRK